MARAVSFREAAARIAPHLPYLAWEGPHPSVGSYRPDYVELFLVTGGEGLRIVTAENGSKTVTRLPAGTLWIFRPMDVQELRPVGRRGFTVVNVAFPFQTWEWFALASELDQRAFTLPDPPRIDVDLDDPAVTTPFQRILEAYRARPDAMDLVRFLVDTVPRFVDAAREDSRPETPAWLWSAVTAMYEEPNLRAGVARLAELSHVSHTHLWRGTRAYFGLSPTDLVTEIRLRHAGLLLASTDDAIATVGERCGFSSPSHFSKAFRRGRLVSPREYRRRARAT
jgi:AraC-like DNA-binding protein